MGRDPVAEEMVRLREARNGDNEPLDLKIAAWDGHRSVRVWMPQGHIGLATATYSYRLTHAERVAVARRLAAIWNFAARQGWSTEQIEGLAAPTDTGRE
jgi:hypothetical protein